MRLVYFNVNNAWGFIVGSNINTARPTSLHGFPLFFESKKEAIMAAKQCGLFVDAKGIVTTKPLSNPSSIRQAWIDAADWVDGLPDEVKRRVKRNTVGQIASFGSQPGDIQERFKRQINWDSRPVKNPMPEDREFFNGGVNRNWTEAESFKDHDDALRYARTIARTAKIRRRDIVVFRSSMFHRSTVYIHNSAVKPRKNPAGNPQGLPKGFYVRHEGFTFHVYDPNGYHFALGNTRSAAVEAALNRIVIIRNDTGHPLNKIIKRWTR